MGGGAIDFEMDTKAKITDRAPAQQWRAPVNSAAPGRGIVLERFFTTRRRRSVFASRMGSAQRRHLGRRRPRRLRAEGRRSAARVVADRDQRRRLEIFSRTARHAAARDQRPPTRSRASSIPSADGATSRVTSPTPTRATPSTPSSSTCCSTRRRRSTARSISTSASRPSRSAPHASSSRSMTAWTRS